MADTLPHEHAVELLPWLANGTLEPAERDAVREHTRSCVICRREIESLEAFAARLAPDAEDDAALQLPDMRSINARIDALLERERRGSVLLGTLRDFAANRWRTAFAVQSLVLAAVAAAWFLAREPEAAYTTLTKSDPAGQLPAGNYLRVVFDPGLEAVELAGLLRERELVVAAGPSAHGVYTLAYEPSVDAAGREATRQALGADPEVLFVQPVSNGETQ